MPTDDKPIVHGLQGYRRGDRCRVCVEANYRAQKAWRAKVRGKPVPARVHGTLNGYTVYGCGCERCLRVQRAAKRRQRSAKTALRQRIEQGLPRDAG